MRSTTTANRQHARSDRPWAVTALREGAWLTRERVRGYAIILLAAYALFIISLVATARGVLDYQGRPLGTDFANLWGAGQLVREGRAVDVFDVSRLAPHVQHLFGLDKDQFWGWHYPPMFLFVAATLATLPYLVALAAWLTATGALYITAVRRAWPNRASDVPLVVLVALAYPAVFANLVHGHNGFLTAGLFGLGLVCLTTRPIAAGIFFGLLAYKPQYGLLLPFALVAGGHWRAIAAATITVAVTAVASAALFGAESWSAFFAHADFTRTTVLEAGAPGWFKLQGVFPAVRMLGGSVVLAYVLQAAAIAGLLAFVVWLWRSRSSDAHKSAGLLLATMLATPYAFNYDSMLLGPAIALLVAHGFQNGFAAYEKSVLAALWLVPLFSREMTAVTEVPIATLVQVIALVTLARTCWHGRSMSGA